MAFSLFGKKILVVEDSAPLSKAVTIKLKSLGLKAIVATSFDEASKLLNKHKGIKAVWLDHWLRENTTGLEVLTFIKSHPAYKDVPVFLVSACGEEWINKYEQLGITKKFVKSDHSMSDIIEEIGAYI